MGFKTKYEEKTLPEPRKVDPPILRLGFILIAIFTRIIPGTIAYLIALFIVPKKTERIKKRHFKDASCDEMTANHPRRQFRGEEGHRTHGHTIEKRRQRISSILLQPDDLLPEER